MYVNWIFFPFHHSSSMTQLVDLILNFLRHTMSSSYSTSSVFRHRILISIECNWTFSFASLLLISVQCSEPKFDEKINRREICSEVNWEVNKKMLKSSTRPKSCGLAKDQTNSIFISHLRLKHFIEARISVERVGTSLRFNETFTSSFTCRPSHIVRLPFNFSSESHHAWWARSHFKGQIKFHCKANICSYDVGWCRR